MKKNKDLVLAIEQRDKNGYSLAVVKNEKTIYKNKSYGIYPLYAAYKDKVDFSGASAADKVVGKGAAIFFDKLNIKELDTIIISKPALEYLQQHNVVVSYAKLVDYIENRNRDGKCPVETIAQQTSQFEAFLDEVQDFLKRMGIINES